VLQREHHWRMTRTHMPGAPFLFFNESVAHEIDIAGPQGLQSGDDRPPPARHMAHSNGILD
jgi:hypothetical protein